MISASRIPLLLAATVILASVANLAWHGMALNRSVALPALDAGIETPAFAEQAPALDQLFAAAPPAISSDAGTLSQLQLQACLVAADPALSRAIILVADSGTVHASPGDMLVEGIQLLSVQPDHIVVRAGGSEHTLSLRPESGPGQI